MSFFKFIPSRRIIFKIRAVNIYGSFVESGGSPVYVTSPAGQMKQVTSVDVDEISANKLSAGTIDEICKKVGIGRYKPPSKNKKNKTLEITLLPFVSYTYQYPQWPL